jgi:Golgi phosphoprotein 3 (GPP34)
VGFAGAGERRIGRVGEDMDGRPAYRRTRIDTHHWRLQMRATLPEELVLVAVDAERRFVCPAGGDALSYGLAGAVVTELLLQGAARVTERGQLAAGDPTGDQLLDDVLLGIRASRPRPVTSWVRVLAGRSVNLHQRLAGRLVRAGVVRQQRRRLFGVLPVRRYAAADEAVLEELRGRLRAGLLGHGALDPRTASLIGLVGACGLVEGLVDRDERRAARGRAATIGAADPAGAAVSAAIRDARAAVVAGATAAVVASTAATSG